MSKDFGEKGIVLVTELASTILNEDVDWEISSIVKGTHMNILYTDDLVLIAESMEDLLEKLKKWKEGMARLLIIKKKTKIMVSDCDTVPDHNVMFVV